MIQRLHTPTLLAVTVGCFFSASLSAASTSPVTEFAQQYLNPFRIGDLFNLAELLESQQAHNDQCNTAYSARVDGNSNPCPVPSFAKYRLPSEQHFYPPVKLLVQGYAQAGKVLDEAGKSGTFAKLAKGKLSNEEESALSDLQNKVRQTSVALEDYLRNRLSIKNIQPKSVFLVKLATSIEKCEKDLLATLNKLLSTPLYASLQNAQADVLNGKSNPLKDDVSTLLTPYHDLLRGDLSWISGGVFSSKPATVKELLRRSVALAHETLTAAVAVNERAIASVKADAGIPAGSIISLWQNRIADASEVFLGSGMVIVYARLLASDIAGKAQVLIGTIKRTRNNSAAIEKAYQTFEKAITQDNQYLNSCLQTIAECSKTEEVSQLVTNFDELYNLYQEARNASYSRDAMLSSRFPGTPLDPASTAQDTP